MLQAVGFISAAQRVPADTALALLLTAAEDDRRDPPDVARDVLARRHPLADPGDDRGASGTP
ncbi:hypothetical protein C5C36_09555 [Rathayibacter sp. AY1G1]|uniref:hypothetical protein n=1 Tax=unclassified Rathayibacter TaxID=2609250 RepID=UPI000CE73564|nr:MULTISPECIES: hypothetical protein [unclassified Rathayibacter]PPF16822.1 hypothetical protein C5B92_10725 [Rathayibacter sp. AY1A4]PPF26851.1 hypothetical protein C5C54_11525 [Rathayibacter sp. AY1F2]PPF54794.1 hypothetical protein C5C55_11385 [Rathayibacter sp. AY1C2]PPG40945.1 hypothetical protein C5C30_09065 [Rathayibacter sp. AY2B5]PPG80925.1 hypothetical protein C5C52_09980 [Rathayibacter sp. AY1E5]